MTAVVIRVTVLFLLVLFHANKVDGQQEGGSRMKYAIARSQCCDGWLAQTSGTKDCDIPVCFGRLGALRGTCMNGGKCVSPDRCQCPDGFRQPKCTDVDECTESTDICGYQCKNTVGSYACICPERYGLMSDGKTCGPVCFDLKPPGTCMNNHECISPDNCDCSDGYLQPKCEDEDECVTSPCQQVCTNTPGSFNCSCEEGFELQPDGKSCKAHCPHVPRGLCPHGGTCVKPGVCECLKGFSPPDCIDIDECAQPNECKQSCQNTDGSYICGCDTGYQLATDRLTCEDVDECKIQHGVCAGTCHNSPGSFSCECAAGLIKQTDGKTCKARCHTDWEPGVCPHGGTCQLTGRCSCRKGFGGKECDNIDECEQGNSGCSHECIDTPGSFMCACPKGYFLQSEVLCKDVDECQGKHGCGGICVNHQGSYSCQCGSGLVLSSDRVSCEDVDECSLGLHGCSHICKNTYGSFKCQCRPGSILSGDGKTCIEKKSCTTQTEEGCWPECRIDGNGACACPAGMTLFTDQKHCIDPCASFPCLHGGKCKPGKKSDYRCDCSKTGYSGNRCQFGSIEFPLNVDVRKSVTYHNLTVRVNSDEDTTIQATSTAQVTIFPNPVTIWKSEDSFNISLRAEESGLLSVKFTVTNSQIRKKSYSMKIRSTDVFSRHQLLLENVPQGCFYLELSEIKQVFRSTKPWFRIKTDSKSYFTFGIADVIVLKTAFPLSNDGLQVIFGSNVHISRLPSRRKKSHGIRHRDSRDKNCRELHFTRLEIQEFNNARSLLRTLFNALKKLLPYWFTLKVMPHTGPKKIPHYFQPKMMLGKNLRNSEFCKIVELEDDVMYTIFLTTDAVDCTWAGQRFHLPEVDETKPYCLISDFVKTGTFVVVGNTDLTDMFAGTPFISTIEPLASVVANPRAVGIFNGWDYRNEREHDFVFYNGESLFEYPPLGDVTLFIKGELSNIFLLGQGNKLEVLAKGMIYSDADITMPFTHMFTKASSYMLTLPGTWFKLTVQIMGTEYSFEWTMAMRDTTIISAGGGDGERVQCGMRANPPGIFFYTKVLRFIPKLAPFQEWVLEFGGDAYTFLTFEEKKDTASGVNSRLLESAIGGLLRRIDKFSKLLNKMKRGKMPMWKEKGILDMKNMSLGISNFASNFDRSNVTLIKFADFTHGLLTKTMALSDTFDVFESRLHVNFDSNAKSSIRVLKKALQLINGQVMGIWWENFDSSTPFYPKDDVYGYKGIVELRLFFAQVKVDLELVFSREGLMRCSDLYEYYDHFSAGDHVVKGKGVIQGSSALFVDSRFGHLVELWTLFKIKRGAGIEIAFSKTKPVFACRFMVLWEVFGVSVSGNVFITNNEVAAMVELEMFKIFRVRLTLGVAVSIKLAIWIQGDFLPGPRQSFQMSLLDAVKRTLKSYNRNAEYRQKENLDSKHSAQRYLIDAQNKISRAKRRLREKHLSFDAAVRKLDAAKVKLEKAKEPFRKAIKKLTATQNKLDSLCKLRECDKQCQNKIDSGRCKNNIIPDNQCLIRKPCYTKFAKFKCLAKNAGCRTIRGLAYAGLVAAKALVAVPMIALDSAKVAVSVAQIVVDKSRFMLDVAKKLYSVAYSGLKWANTVLQFVIVAQKKLNEWQKSIFKMFKAMLINVLQKFIDLRRCGFRVELSVKNWFQLDCYCEINFMSRGWANHSFSLNLKDISSSMFGIARSTVDKAKREADNSRRKRDVKSPNNYRSDFNDSDEGDSLRFKYDSWALKCQRYNSVGSFLKTSLEILKNFSRQISQDADAAERDIIQSGDEDDSSVAITLDDVGVDVGVALGEFNLTRHDIERALTTTSLEKDELVMATKDFKTAIGYHNREAIQTVRDSSVTTSWVSYMDTITYFRDCLNFRDCVIWSFGELTHLLESLDTDVADVYMDALITLQTEFQDVIRNDSKTLNQTIDPNIDLSVLVTLGELFCGSMPVIIKAPENLTAEVGQVANFHCIGNSKPTPTYYWFRGEVLIDYGKNWTTLNLNNISSADGGWYSCRVVNHMGNVSSPPVYLRVVYAPKITTDLPAVIELRPGDNGSPKARLDGRPRPRVIWYMCTPRVCRVKQSSEFPGLPDGFHSGELIYKYKGHNPYGEVDSAEMLIVVHHRQPAVPKKVLHVWYVISLVNEDAFDAEADDLANRSTILQHLQSALSRTYTTSNGSLKLEITAADFDKRYIAITLQPTREILQFAEKSVDFMEAVLLEINTTVAYILRDGSVGATIYNDTRQIYSFRLSDEVREDPVQFHCKRPLVFQPPSHCVRKPRRFELAPPTNIKVTRTAGHIFLRWEPPFYDGYLLKAYSVCVSPENGAASLQNTSSREPSLSLPVATCGEVCEIHVSALTASRRSPWTVLKVYLESVALAPDNSQDEPVSHTVSPVVGIPIGVISVLGLVCALAAAVAVFKYRVNFRSAQYMKRNTKRNRDLHPWD